MTIYLDDATYLRLVTALANAKPCPATGHRENAIKLALGEAGDIWPEHSRGEEEG